jgi:hypothetical protein
MTAKFFRIILHVQRTKYNRQNDCVENAFSSSVRDAEVSHDIDEEYAKEIHRALRILVRN